MLSHQQRGLAKIVSAYDYYKRDRIHVLGAHFEIPIRL
jgi:hypothetical protein